MRYPEKHRSSALYQQVHSHLGETIVFQRPRDVEIKEAQFEMKLAVLSDFDGTVTLNDTFQNVLEKFGQGDRRAVDDQYVKGEITLEECLRRQGGMVRASKPQVLDELDQVTKFRHGFDNLAEYCRTNQHPLVLVSAGLDFVIKHFLARQNLVNMVQVSAAVAKCAPTGIKFRFLKLKDNRSMNFKDVVRSYRTRAADTVAYIGDGRWDLQGPQKRGLEVRDKELEALRALQRAGDSSKNCLRLQRDGRISQEGNARARQLAGRERVGMCPLSAVVSFQPELL